MRVQFCVKRVGIDNRDDDESRMAQQITARAGNDRSDELEKCDGTDEFNSVHEAGQKNGRSRRGAEIESAERATLNRVAGARGASPGIHRKRLPGRLEPSSR
jgi:hypothetical protein